jgi:hypothetical protein
VNGQSVEAFTGETIALDRKVRDAERLKRAQKEKARENRKGLDMEALG